MGKPLGKCRSKFEENVKTELCTGINLLSTGQMMMKVL
jgi:hypothetical protein